MSNLECRFQDIEMLGVLRVLGPKAFTSDEMTSLSLLNPNNEIHPRTGSQSSAGVALLQAACTIGII